MYSMSFLAYLAVAFFGYHLVRRVFHQVRFSSQANRFWLMWDRLDVQSQVRWLQGHVAINLEENCKRYERYIRDAALKGESPDRWLDLMTTDQGNLRGAQEDYERMSSKGLTDEFGRIIKSYWFGMTSSGDFDHHEFKADIEARFAKLSQADSKAS